MYYVYVLSSIGWINELYIGSTNDLRSRIKTHNDGKSPSTRRYLPWKLIYYEAYETESLARMREQKLKYHGNALKELKKRIGWVMKKGFTQHRDGAGFTFIEIVVAAGIIAIISGVSAQIFLTATRNAAKSEIIQNVKQNGEFSMEVMSRMIQNAKSVSSCTGAPMTSLTIVNQDGGSSTFACAADGAATRVASQSAIFGTQYLTTAGLSLGGDTCDSSTLVFECEETPGLPSKVIISFTLSQIGNTGPIYEQASVPLKTTVSVRSVGSE